MFVTFSVIFTVTELELGLIEILIDRIGTGFVKPSQSLVTDVCSCLNTDICRQAIIFRCQRQGGFHLKAEQH